MTISSPGIGSNLDVSSIVNQLMQIEQQPVVRLNQTEAGYQAQLSAFGTLKGAVSTFQSTMSGLADASKFLALTATSSDSSMVSASTGSLAVPGSYSIEVSALAQGQKLVAAGTASNATAIGEGTITFDFGTLTGGVFDSGTGKYTSPATFTSTGAATKDVTIDASNSSLSGIRDAINAADVGMNATIVNDGSATVPYRLVLTSDATGAAVSAKITVTGDAALSNLIAHDPTGTPAAQNLSQTLTAQNAAFTVDGMNISKASNTVSDVISGLTLTLAKLTGATPVTLTVTRDASGAQNSAQSFVNAYNSLAATLTSLTGYNAATKTGGLLQGDSTARSVDTSVRSVLSTALAGAGVYTTLSQLGIGFEKDGTLALNSATLQAALASNTTNVAAVFAQIGQASDGLVAYSGASSSTVAGSFAVAITQIATQATSVGSAAAGLTIDATNDTLEVTLNGVAATVTLASGTYGTAAALALEVQSKINSATEFSAVGSSITAAADVGDVITLTSTLYGSASGITVTGGNGVSNLLGLTPTDTSGLNVAGTIGGVAATGSGQTLTGATGSDSAGLQLLITGGATGNRGTVNYSRGYATQLSDLADSILGTSGTIANRTDGINSTIKDIGNRRDTLNLRLEAIQKRYLAQFTALDLLISSMTATSTFLTQQLASLPQIVSNN